jgi:hypothetical protein
MAELELIPPEEAAQIETIVKLTIEQLKQRYPGAETVRRSVHVKDHGCVTARFKIIDTLPPDLRVGVFATPGHEYDAYVRFSNAAVAHGPDSLVGNDGVPKHGSRGMAVKLLGVNGAPLVPTFGPVTQDFLMTNQPVFAFSNIEDYAALNQILLADRDQPDRFFAERVRIKNGAPDLTDSMTQRALGSLKIVKRVQSAVMPPAYQVPPASPVDNRYFSAAPFLFGDDRVMKFSASPVSPSSATAPDVGDADYLRKALHKRLNASGARDIVFEFQVQVREASELADKIATDIEDACFEWDEQRFPFVTVATITIPPQDFDTEKQRVVCERLIFTPWHGLLQHRPLGGINRLRLAVYEASAHRRLMPKEPAHL